jgi:UDP-N-acetylglucosamine--N-acetylmuramyl-(pentapeptide) pyrophosphoryl-undecaprenol N-acetylglucosamine transferase
MIGWYVHHRGRGHLTRLGCVAPQVQDDVTVLSSLPAQRMPGVGEWLELDHDDAGTGHTDPTAQGLLHWAPRHHAGLSHRMAAVAGWIASARPRLMVVDVSVEVTALARLCGVPVVVVAGPGDRADAPHQLAYGMADRIIAAWPQDVYDPPFLHPHRPKTRYVGALSRFDAVSGSVDAVATGAPAGRGGVVVLNGAGGSAVDAALLDAAGAATPGWSWTGLGVAGGRWCEDVWAALLGADVVVTHAGQNALAEVAAARVPTVVVPQPRPFAEQHRVAAALAGARIAVTADAWPPADRWAHLISETLELGGSSWKRWNDGSGAERFAAATAEPLT